MDLGTFYLAMNVEDIKKSFDFYSNFGFEPVENGGSIEDKWLVMANGSTKVGLFQGMFPKNTLTFNPTDARTIYRELSAKNMEVHSAGKIDEPSGPCYFMLTDPDGNPILVDQHV